MREPNFKPLKDKITFPEMERAVLEYWETNNIFEKSLELRKNAKRYSFYDGPPFATGTPHYGHIVASTIKDVIPRYQTMKGFYVERKWGWDCHGLPIENIAEKELKITHKKEILKFGVEKFNEFCRSKVLGYVDEWKKVITRLGRWADIKNAYKTMDLNFMESVWWVFKELYNKNLIYEGYRSMHICPRCETTLSQSEVAEGYRDVKDLSAVVKFELVDEPRTYLLAWTTTPWTLFGNVALAVNKDIKYIKVHLASHPEPRTGGEGSHKLQDSSAKPQNDINKSFILAKDRVKEVIKDQDYKIIKELSGSDLAGKKYKPLFNFPPKPASGLREFVVVTADFVDDQEGTGIVHIAPAFGEDDLELSKKENLSFIQHIGMDGIIKEGYGEFSGLSVKPIEDIQSTDVVIIKYLAQKNLLFSKEQYAHSYPHCWRCETPLLNYATSSWFVKVIDLKPKALELAKEINWFPKHIKNGRFGKWLENARDWSISRQRFWASVIPIWICGKDKNHLKVIGSVRELEELSGRKVGDIHKHIVDKISFKCPDCGGEMTRVPDVLDTWFDSGSMPYAQKHYPFEHKEEFERSFPADFIAEGSDQTRAWFYYLHVLSTALMKKPAFKNAVVNGIVLAEDGKKMSKRLQNYPDPMAVFDKYGADTLRLYLMSSPVVAAENLNFSEKEVGELSRGVMRMLWNSYSFFVLYANIDGFKPTKGLSSNNLLDKWIISELNQLIDSANRAFDSANLAKAARLFPAFIDNLSNWYIRRSRKRFWKSENDLDKECAYQTLHLVLAELTKVMAPVTPFVSEEIFRNLSGNVSVHLEDYPKADKRLIDEDLTEQMIRVRKIVELALFARNQAKIRIRQPLQSLRYHSARLDEELEAIIADELNIKEIINDPKQKDEIVLDTDLTEDLMMEGEAREIVRQIQQKRKEAGFSVDDRISLNFNNPSSELKQLLTKHGHYIKNEVLAEEINYEKAESDFEGEISSLGQKLFLGLKRIR